MSSSSILPNNQFGFHSAHSVIDKFHRLVNAISFFLEKKMLSLLLLLWGMAQGSAEFGTYFFGLAKISAGVPQRDLIYSIYIFSIVLYFLTQPYCNLNYVSVIKC